MEQYWPGNDTSTLQRKKWLLLAAVACVLFVASAASAQNPGNRIDEIDAALHNQEFDKALELLRSALQMAPRNEQLWAMQGKAYAGQGHNKEALASFDNALRTAPDY